jgi:hypothetical protein
MCQLLTKRWNCVLYLLGRSSGFQVASTHRPCTKGTATLENWPWWNSVQSLTVRQWRNRCLWSNSKRIYLIKMNWWLLCWFYVLTVQELMKWLVINFINWRIYFLWFLLIYNLHHILFIFPHSCCFGLCSNCCFGLPSIYLISLLNTCTRIVLWIYQAA